MEIGDTYVYLRICVVQRLHFSSQSSQWRYYCNLHSIHSTTFKTYRYVKTAFLQLKKKKKKALHFHF